MQLGRSFQQRLSKLFQVHPDKRAYLCDLFTDLISLICIGARNFKRPINSQIAGKRKMSLSKDLIINFREVYSKQLINI